MSEFKKGDRVRYVGLDEEYNVEACVGATGTVSARSLASSGDIPVDWDEVEAGVLRPAYAVKPKNIALLDEEQPQAATFTVGDRVRLRTDPINTKGEVISVSVNKAEPGAWGPWVLFGDPLSKRQFYYPARDVELVEAVAIPEHLREYTIQEPVDPDACGAADPFEHAVRILFHEAADLLLSKHRDYGPLNIALSPGGPTNGLRVRLHDKLARLNNLLDSGQEPEHEAIEDTWRDLIGYSAIGLLVERGLWPSQ